MLPHDSIRSTLSKIVHAHQSWGIIISVASLLSSRGGSRRWAAVAGHGRVTSPPCHRSYPCRGCSAPCDAAPPPAPARAARARSRAHPDRRRLAHHRAHRRAHRHARHHGLRRVRRHVRRRVRRRVRRHVRRRGCRGSPHASARSGHAGPCRALRRRPTPAFCRRPCRPRARCHPRCRADWLARRRRAAASEAAGVASWNGRSRLHRRRSCRCRRRRRAHASYRQRHHRRHRRCRCSCQSSKVQTTSRPGRATRAARPYRRRHPCLHCHPRECRALFVPWLEARCRLAARAACCFHRARPHRWRRCHHPLS